MSTKKLALVGFGLPAAIKSLSAQLTASMGQRTLGSVDAGHAARIFFRIGGGA